MARGENLNILLTIAISALTTVLVIWLHILGFTTWDRYRAKQAAKHFKQVAWHPKEEQETTKVPVQAVFAPLSNAEALSELLLHEVGLRVKKNVHVKGVTSTGEHKIAEEIRSLKRLSTKLEPL